MCGELKRSACGGNEDGAQVHALIGLRAIACIWVVGFHVLCILPSVMPADAFVAARDHWSMAWFRSGNSAVDIFFVLTGFLLAYPLFAREFKLNLNRAATDDAYDTCTFTALNVVTFWYRRFVVRIWPPLIVAVALYCLVIYPPHMPGSAGCDNFGWMYTLSFTSNFYVLQSCMPWAWSLAVQAHWYLLFPLLVRMAGRARTLAWLCAGVIALTVALRYYLAAVTYATLPFHARMPVVPAEFMTYAAWFIPLIAPSYLRGSAFAIGALAAYVVARCDTSAEAEASAGSVSVSASASASASLRVRSVLQRVPGIVHAVALYALLIRELPGHSGDSMLGAVAADHPLYYALNYLGGPVFCGGLAYAIVLATQRITFVGEALSRVLCARVWVPIARGSYFVYLTHFAIVQRVTIITGLYTVAQATTTNSLQFLWAVTIGFITLTVFVGIVLYAFVEKPLTAAISRVERFICPSSQVATKPKRDD